MSRMRAFGFAVIMGISACVAAANIAHAQSSGGHGGQGGGGGGGPGGVGDSGSPMKAIAYVRGPKGKRNVPVDLADPSNCSIYYHGEIRILCRPRRHFE